MRINELTLRARFLIATMGLSLVLFAGFALDPETLLHKLYADLYLASAVLNQDMFGGSSWARLARRRLEGKEPPENDSRTAEVTCDRSTMPV